VTIKVGRGEPFSSVVRRLKDAGAIPNEKIFSLWARLWRLDKKIHWGVYHFELPMTPAAVLNRMIPGRGAFRRITVPEGLTAREIAGLLADAKIGDKDRLLAETSDPDLLAQLGLADKGIEGYLFPDTYYFPDGMTEDEVLAAMVEAFHAAMDPLLKAPQSPALSAHEVVTLASMIEKETGNAAERPLVAAVFYNRMKIGLPLQSDPTAVYELDARRKITHKDLQNQSPYNTYRIKGLPPGPICNPGVSSLKAALAPADVPYLYFVSKNDGSHSFSVELAEHNRAVKTYQGGDNKPAKVVDKRVKRAR